jgi:hypothetical protein
LLKKSGYFSTKNRRKMFIVSVYFKVAFALITVGLVLQVVGFAFPYWFSYSRINGGLWQTCSDSYERLNLERCQKNYGKSWLYNKLQDIIC